MLESPVKAAATALLAGLLVAGCGGGGKDRTTTSAPPPAASVPAMQAPATSPPSVPTATTNTPPTQHRTTPQPSSNEPLKVGSSYRCGGRRLKTLDARGPIDVRPAVVKPGQVFTVRITAKNVQVAVVSLAGVSRIPIQANAKPQNGNLVATIKMPAGAGCGNKLLEIEGDMTAEAFIGVSR